MRPASLLLSARAGEDAIHTVVVLVARILIDHAGLVPGPAAGSWAVIGAVNKLESSVIPLLARPQGGVAASSRKFRATTEADAAGVVFHLFHRKTTPASRSAEASQ